MDTEENKKSRLIDVLIEKVRGRVKLIIVITLSVFLALLIFFVTAVPKNFPVGIVVEIDEGKGLMQISNDLKQNSVISYPVALRTIIKLVRGENRLIAGDYYFEKGLNTFQIAKRLMGGKFNLDLIKVTVREGASIKEISKILSQVGLKNFDAILFEQLTLGKEGYLFPDTYLLRRSANAKQIIAKMERNFYSKIGTQTNNIATSERTLGEIITMSSILEGEAKTTYDKKVIAGVLWKRLDSDMRLQVDAPFAYYIGKSTSDLTIKDLMTDNPYNTYRRLGLPAGPIGNPGMDSILAALNPIKTEYLYYLSDKEGNMHYARTFEEHKINKARYIR